MRKFTLSFLLAILTVGTKAFAYDFSAKNADGIEIYYNYIKEQTEAEVTRGNYEASSIKIPEEVTVNNKKIKVTSIGKEAFAFCQDLKTVSIPNTVTYIGIGAFAVTYLTSIEIPNSVTTIEYGAFQECYKLTSVTIPNSVKSIGRNAFDDCDKLNKIVSLIENPFEIEGVETYKNTFQEETFLNATLYVPKGTKEKYMATNGWKDFKNIVEGNGDNDATNIAETHEKSVLIQSKGGVLYVSGIENGTSINVYSVSGTLIGTTKVSNNQASLNTNLDNGDIAIVKIGDKSVKINIQ